MFTKALFCCCYASAACTAPQKAADKFDPTSRKVVMYKPRHGSGMVPELNWILFQRNKK